MTVFNEIQCKRGAGNHQVGGIPNGSAGLRCEHRRIVSQLSHQNFGVCPWNVATARGRSNEMVNAQT